MKNKIIILVSLLLASFSQAEIWIPSIFSDNMLFQRNDKVKIWGKADANAKVDIKFSNQSKSVKADKNGDWVAYLDKMSANKTPQQLEISENGKLQKTISNILVGEVWVLGGQSNMAYLVMAVDGFKQAKEFADKYNNIRYFGQNVSTLSKTYADDVKGGIWKICNSKNVGSFSGTGFYFAKNLYDKLDVPIGLVSTALGGSNMMAWTPEHKFENLSIYQKRWADFKSKMSKYDYDDAVAKWKIAYAQWEAKGEGNRPRWAPDKPLQISVSPARHTPAYLFNGVVAPLRNYTLKGVLWYQGEADAKVDNVKNFKKQYELIVESWREAFNNNDIYFLNAQLPSFGISIKNADWAGVRWSQYQATKELKNAYFANIIDTGLEKNIHPPEKPIVGLRLANIALKNIYGFSNIIDKGNDFTNVKYDGNSVKIAIDDSKSKIVIDGNLRGFEVKVDDDWQEANASLDGNVLTISSNNKDDKVNGVRYLWKNWAKPDVCIFNAEGLPSMQFIDENK